ncbi:response regulator [Sulfitobacter mediterraneus]|uniref:response regulator n=1 Tax=Sulfitobacter mediterraneus TaxID=83219 RepID=UPI0021A8A04D|nr:response regulator [Sulfitobacter mediterraneus]UWR10783.1 response regulator [Sulfitobacter mediterraneus]
MSDTQDTVDLSDQIARELPYLRRYARALTGSQTSGDNYAIATLEAILEDRSIIQGDMTTKVGLFKCFHAIWSSSGAPVVEDGAGALGKAQAHLASLAPNTREALLLSTVEEFTIAQVATIMTVSDEEAQHLIATARTDMENSVSGRILIIEDEPIIAADLSAIVSDLGHTVTGVGRTRADAVAKGKGDKPDLILADIQLADNSSGIDAVNDLLAELGDTPVIFITAFPERLLTGDRPEPAFMIAKPYKEDQVQSAVSQAMFFASTETLKR